ncbi:MAG: Gfo/Idh/MocA family protein [Armatimonadota bacterium]
MADKLRIGMVCCAGIGATHVTDWRYLEDRVQITAAMDVDAELAKNTARISGGVPWTTDLDELLARDDVDAVDICSPPFAHADQIVKAAQAGKHVLCEKPLAVNLEDADRSIAACKKAGVKLMIAFPIPYMSAYRRLKEMIQTAEMGKPIHIYSTHHMRAEWLRKRTGWFFDPKKSGGTAIEGVIHNFQLLPWLMGPVKRIYAEAGTFIYTDRQPTLPDDQLVVLLRFENDAIGIINGGANAPSNFGGGLSLFFTKGGVELGHGRGMRIYRGMTEYNPVVEDVRQFEPEGDDTELRTSYISPTGHLGEMIHFVDCVVNNKTPLTSGEQGRYALECAWAAIKSFQTTMPVALPLTKPYPSY